MNTNPLYYLTKDEDNVDLWQLGNPGVYVYVRRLRGKPHGEQWTCPIQQSARYEYIRNYTNILRNVISYTYY